MNREQSKEDKYHLLVNQYQRDLLRYAYWLTGNKEVAEDILQETFLRAWRNIDQLNDVGAAKSWMITILRRENARRFERKQLPMVDLDTELLVDQHDAYEAQQQQEQLQQSIMMLADDYREPLMLQVIAGYSGDEIAKQLNMNKNTVMTRLFRAKKQLMHMINITVDE